MENIGLFKVHAGLGYPHLSLEACLKVCMETSTCKAVNYDKIKRVCTILNNHTKGTMNPSDCCNLYTKSIGPCSTTLVQPLVKKIEYPAYIRKRYVLNDRGESVGTGRMAGEIITEPSGKKDKTAEDSSETTPSPFFVILNKDSSGNSTSAVGAITITPKISEDLNGGNSGKRSRISTMTSTSKKANNTSPLPITPSNMTQEEGVLSTTKPIPNKNGSKGGRKGEHEEQQEGAGKPQGKQREKQEENREEIGLGSRGTAGGIGGGGDGKGAGAGSGGREEGGKAKAGTIYEDGKTVENQGNGKSGPEDRNKSTFNASTMNPIYFEGRRQSCLFQNQFVHILFPAE